MPCDSPPHRIQGICGLAKSCTDSPTMLSIYSSLLPGHGKQTTMPNPFTGQQRHTASLGVKRNHRARLCGAQAVPRQPPLRIHTPCCEQQGGCEGKVKRSTRHCDEKDKPFKAAFRWFPAGNVRLPMTSPPGGGRVRLWDDKEEPRPYTSPFKVSFLWLSFWA